VEHFASTHCHHQRMTGSSGLGTTEENAFPRQVHLMFHSRLVPRRRWKLGALILEATRAPRASSVTKQMGSQVAFIFIFDCLGRQACYPTVLARRLNVAIVAMSRARSSS